MRAGSGRLQRSAAPTNNVEVCCSAIGSVLLGHQIVAANVANSRNSGCAAISFSRGGSRGVYRYASRSARLPRGTMTSEPMDNKVLWLLRRDDMVVLELLFKNLSRVVDSSGAATLVVTDPGQPAQLIVDFPPQAVREEVFDSSTAAPTLQMVCNARFSGLCRLTFQIPPNGPSLVFTTAGLLAWIGLPTVDAPLECVWGLSFSPAFRPNDVWLHAQQPGTSTGGVTGLWHTSLMGRDSTGMPNFTNRDPMPMVAVFTGVALPNPDFPAPMGVDDLQRINDVSATSPLGARE